jgi:hypothetical protein
MIVTPDTVLRWHRDIIRRHWAAKSRRKRPAGRRSTAMSAVWCFAWPARIRVGLPQDSR